MTEERYQEIRVALPLPLDMVGQLMSAVGAAWPDTTIDTTVDNALVFKIPDSNRFTDSTPVAVEIPPVTLTPIEDKENVGTFHGWNENGLLMSQPDFTGTLLNICQAMFEATPAENYLEMTVREPYDTMMGTQDEWTVILVKPNGKTPHQLRLEAEERANEAELALGTLLASSQ